MSESGPSTAIAVTAMVSVRHEKSPAASRFGARAGLGARAAKGYFPASSAFH